MTDTLDLGELERLLAGDNSLPWEIGYNERGEALLLDGEGFIALGEDDALLAVAAVNALPALVAIARAARAVTQYRATCPVCKWGPWEHEAHCPIGQLAVALDGHGGAR